MHANSSRRFRERAEQRLSDTRSDKLNDWCKSELQQSSKHHRSDNLSRQSPDLSHFKSESACACVGSRGDDEGREFTGHRGRGAEEIKAQGIEQKKTNDWLLLSSLQRPGRRPGRWLDCGHAGGAMRFVKCTPERDRRGRSEKE